MVLTEEAGTISLGESFYVTPDPERRLSADIIGMRFENNDRGTPNNNAIINFGFASTPVWLVASVTNHSDSDTWFLDLGSMSKGRFGLLQKLFITDYHTKKILLDYDVRQQKNTRFESRFIPINTTRGQTSLLIIHAEMNHASAATLALTAQTERAHSSIFQKDIGAFFANLFFIAALSVFLCIAFIFKDRAYAFFGGMIAFYAASYAGFSAFFMAPMPYADLVLPLLQPFALICGIIATKHFFDMQRDKSSENLTLTFLALLIGLSALTSLAPPHSIGPYDTIFIFVSQILTAAYISAISIQNYQAGKAGGLFIAGSWILLMLAHLITAGTGFHVLSPSALNTNIWWAVLVPYSLLIFMAGLQKFKSTRIEERAHYARESRAALSLAQLRQSKESADQTRLLRVIERERELMTELREREILRTDEMRKAKDMADKANAAKSAFLAVVSHEIRTPMNGMMGILRLMKDTKMTKEQMDYLLTIQKSGETMMALLNDILDFEKIESGNMDLEFIDFDLPRLVQGVTTLMIGHAATKNISLRSDIAENVPRFLKGDPNRLRQVLLNLVNNAIKFTESGSVKIIIRAAAIPAGKSAQSADFDISFAVEDTGIGISDTAQEKLFTAFQQADSSTARKYGGTGLGLVICQRLVEAMGGSIHVTSEPGKGSTFYFKLPMKIAAGSADETGETQKLQTLSVINAMSLLVVEDNDVNRKVMRGFLEKDGHHVTDTDSGEDALLLCGKNSFDAIFLDINLSGMSGLQVAQKIRALPNRKKAGIPIIAITGNVADSDIADIRAAGINDYLPKPVDFDQLLAVLRKVHAEHYKPENNPADIEKFFTIDTDDSASIDPADKEESDVSPMQMFLKNMNKDSKTVTASANADVFDQKILESLARALDKKQISELMKSFVTKADEIVSALTHSPETLGAQALMNHAHDLKGMAANFGMKELSEIARKIENAARADRVDEAVQETKYLQDANARAKNAIAGWL